MKISIKKTHDLKDSGMSEYAKELLKKVTFKEETVDIKIVTLSEWFTEYPTTREIEERMKKEGLDYAPASIAPFLFYEVKNSEWIYVFHEPITASVGYPRVFRVKRFGDGARWLDTDWTHPRDGWHLDNRIVFKASKPSALKLSDSTIALALGALDAAEEAISKAKKLLLQ